MKPLFVVGGLYSKANGIAWIMRDLASGLGKLNAPVDVYAADSWGIGARSIGEIFEPPTRWFAEKGLWLGGLSWSPKLKRTLATAVQSADIVHNHSLWMLPTSYATRSASALKKPTVFTCHGALTPWALKHSRWKKQLVGRIFQYRDLKLATCLHVNSVPEMEQVRSLGYQQPIAVIPNGVNLSDFDNLPAKGSLSEIYPELKGKRIALFMARIHQKKGVDLLLEAWSRIANSFPDWHLVIAGPDDGMLHCCQRIVQQHNISNRVLFTGNLQGVEKLAALSAADAFVLPSHSEGFSMAIIEAMAARLAGLITSGCNFPEATKSGAALEVEPVSGEIQAGLAQLFSMSDSERESMGNRGRRLIEDHYTWAQVSFQTLQLYRWLVYKQEMPNFVFEAGS